MLLKFKEYQMARNVRIFAIVYIVYLIYFEREEASNYTVLYFKRLIFHLVQSTVLGMKINFRSPPCDNPSRVIPIRTRKIDSILLYSSHFFTFPLNVLFLFCFLLQNILSFHILVSSSIHFDRFD